MNEIVIYMINDWAVLYVNGKEANQDHTIDVYQLIRYCPIKSIKVIQASESLNKYVVKFDGFPSTLEEAKKIQLQILIG